jgi:hypothetical protein
VTALILLLALLLGLNQWLLEPAMHWLTELLELKALPWLLTAFRSKHLHAGGSA